MFGFAISGARRQTQSDRAPALPRVDPGRYGDLGHRLDGFRELFARLNQSLGQTIVMITHNLEAAQVGHRIIEMKDGRIVRQVATARAAEGVPA